MIPLDAVTVSTVAQAIFACLENEQWELADELTHKTFEVWAEAAVRAVLGMGYRRVEDVEGVGASAAGGDTVSTTVVDSADRPDSLTAGLLNGASAPSADVIRAVLGIQRPCDLCLGTGWVCDEHDVGDDCWREHDGSRSGCPTCTRPGECGGRGTLGPAFIPAIGFDELQAAARNAVDERHALESRIAELQENCPFCGHEGHHGEQCSGLSICECARVELCACAYPDPYNRSVVR